MRIGAAFALGLAGLAAGCSPSRSSEAGEPAKDRTFVILSVTTGPEASPGPIQGSVKCGGDGLLPVPPCLEDDLALAQAVLGCGPVQATIDRGQSHRLRVHFPARLSDRFPDMPGDLEIVRCVQRRVGFAFSAGDATDPETLEADGARFAALHARRP